MFSKQVEKDIIFRVKYYTGLDFVCDVKYSWRKDPTLGQQGKHLIQSLSLMIVVFLQLSYAGTWAQDEGGRRSICHGPKHLQLLAARKTTIHFSSII